jgi:protein SCO1/2
MHGVVTHVIDKSGNLRAHFHDLKFDETNFILYVNALTNDYH